MMDDLRVLIVAEHASARFGGEATIPLHYYRMLRKRRVEVWLLTHARTRDELADLFPNDDRIVYVKDTLWHRAMWQISRRLPEQVAYLTTGFLARFTSQLSQRRIVRRMVREQGITLVHQPIPVSPREPSMLFGFGIPVVIGPMNGGMDYPPDFHRERGGLERILMRAGRASAKLMNSLMPGKRQAALLLVANQRTRDALPDGLCRNIGELVENGVDLQLWHPTPLSTAGSSADVVTFVFVGRLVGWKAVDLVLRAFAMARGKVAIRLWVIGEGDERSNLERLAKELALEDKGLQPVGSVHFTGWLTQPECMHRLNAADCLVLPSLLECGGAVVLEAMSLAKPVIATAWGGPLDYLDDSCGILVPPRSRQSIVEGIAQAMVELASSPQTRRRLGARALDKVRAHYSWDAKVDAMLDFYRQTRPGAAPLATLRGNKK